MHTKRKTKRKFQCDQREIASERDKRAQIISSTMWWRQSWFAECLRAEMRSSFLFFFSLFIFKYVMIFSVTDEIPIRWLFDCLSVVAKTEIIERRHRPIETKSKQRDKGWRNDEKRIEPNNEVIISVTMCVNQLIVAVLLHIYFIFSFIFILQ